MVRGRNKTKKQQTKTTRQKPQKAKVVMAMSIDEILGMNTAAKFEEAKKEIFETEKRKAQGNAAIAEFLEPFSWKCERWNSERRQSRHHVTNAELNEMYWQEFMATRESGGSIYDAAENGAYVQAYA